MPHQRLTRGALLATFGAAAAAFAYRGINPARAASNGFAVTHSDAEWLRMLGPARYAILRENGTEPPWSSPLNHEKRAGIYACAACDLHLFSSTTKFDDPYGWPSFYRPLPDALARRADYELAEERTEVHCQRCGSHVGHVFDDGPPPTGLRYCIDGLALHFLPGLRA